jgi:hypothetical protein
MKYFEKVADLDKSAKISVEDVEDRLHLYLDDRDEQRARELIDYQTAKRLGVRHPVLTGIPTLGIWPAISKDQALGEITRRMLKEDPTLLKAHTTKTKELRADELEEIRARSLENAADSLGSWYYLANRNREEY